jgi:hypothetical protein
VANGYSPSRAIVANQMATNAAEWCGVFGLHNSGTYNNQWMVADYMAVRAYSNENTAKGLLWILECASIP